MIDLDAKIRWLVERNIPRKDIVSELDAIASDAESRAKRFKRAKKKRANDIGRRARGHSAPESGGYFSFYIMACQHKGQLMLTFSSMISWRGPLGFRRHEVGQLQWMAREPSREHVKRGPSTR